MPHSFGGLGNLTRSSLGVWVRSPAVTVPPVMGDLLAVPYAMYMGTITGPRAVAAGSRVITHVTTGAELMAALQVANNYIVFDKAGNYAISDQVDCANNIFVAGLTAPSPGVTLYPTSSIGSLFRPGDNNIFMHLRGRGQNGQADIFATNLVSTGVLFMNLSSSWARDGLYDGSATDWTTYRCLGYQDAIGMFTSWFKGESNQALIQSVFGHGSASNVRCPMIKSESSVGSGHKLFADNLYYNLGRGGGGPGGVSQFDDEILGAGTYWPEVIMTGCKYKSGPDEDADGIYIALLTEDRDTGGGEGKIWLGANAPSAGANEFENPRDTSPDVSGNPVGFYFADDGGETRWTQVDAAPFTVPTNFSYYNAASIAILEAYLKNKVGARPLDRDATDAAFIAELVAGTGSMLANETQPALPSLTATDDVWAEPADPHDQATGEAEGYTNIEKALWLAHLAVGGVV